LRFWYKNSFASQQFFRQNRLFIASLTPRFTSTFSVTSKGLIIFGAFAPQNAKHVLYLNALLLKVVSALIESLIL
jgi:hypothetical protein